MEELRLPLPPENTNTNSDTQKMYLIDGRVEEAFSFSKK